MRLQDAPDEVMALRNVDDYCMLETNPLLFEKEIIMKKIFTVHYWFILAILTGWQTSASPGNQPIFRVLPKIDIRPLPADYSFKQKSLKTIHPYEETRGVWQLDLRSCTLKGSTLTVTAADLQYALFDSKTIWPERMPPGFDPRMVLEKGKNPGLEIRALHQQGITGRGVNIAIIDQQLLVDHIEYKGRIMLYEEIDCRGRTASMHGPAVASLAAGKTTGTAPDARIFYIACSVMDRKERNLRNFSDMAIAVRRILAINRTLPAPHKIRVISLSVGWFPTEKGADQLTTAIKSAAAAGIFVVSANLLKTYGVPLIGLHRDPDHNPEMPASYRIAYPWISILKTPCPNRKRLLHDQPLLIPMNNRTMASPTGTQDYVHFGIGGISWSIPYLAGVYALACQVKPTITPPEFMSLAMRTGVATQYLFQKRQESFGRIIQPKLLLGSLLAR